MSKSEGQDSKFRTVLPSWNWFSQLMHFFLLKSVWKRRRKGEERYRLGAKDKNMIKTTSRELLVVVVIVIANKNFYF